MAHGVYLVNLRHCAYLLGVLKSMKSADFFDIVTLSLFSYIGQQVSYNIDYSSYKYRDSQQWRHYGQFSLRVGTFSGDISLTLLCFFLDSFLFTIISESTS